MITIYAWLYWILLAVICIYIAADYCLSKRRGRLFRQMKKLIEESSAIRTRYHDALMFYARGGEDEGQRALRAFHETLQEPSEVESR